MRAAMDRRPQDQLGHVSEQLEQMTQLAGSAINRATAALLSADLNLAESVIAADEQLDVIASNLEEEGFDLSSSQPTPAEIRVIFSALRISSSLERMGDLAVHVAKQARLRYPKPAVPEELRDTFAQMGSLGESIVYKTGTVIAERDVALAADVARNDDAIDRLHRELFTIVLSPSWPHGVEEAIDVTLLSRYYERFADHAVTISKRVVHIVTGEPYLDIKSS